MYPVVYAQKLLGRGRGGTLLIHTSELEQLLKILMKHYATVGHIAEGGMLINLTVPIPVTKKP